MWIIFTRAIGPGDLYEFGWRQINIILSFMAANRKKKQEHLAFGQSSFAQPISDLEKDKSCTWRVRSSSLENDEGFGIVNKYAAANSGENGRHLEWLQMINRYHDHHHHHQ